jgi:hypothetical protein
MSTLDDLVGQLRAARAARDAELGIVTTDPCDPHGILARGRAARAGRPPPDLSHLDDLDALMARLNARWDAEYTQYVAEHPGDDGDEDEPPARRTRQRKPTLSGVIRQIERAGLEIARCEYNRDGTVNVVTGKPSVEISDDTAPIDRSEWN